MLAGALGNIVATLFLFASIYIYVSLIRQISARRSTSTAEPARRFEAPEATVAAVLVFLFVRTIVASSARPPANLTNRELVASFFLVLALVMFVAIFLKVRGFNLTALAGFSKINFSRVIVTGAVLLLFACPLLLSVEALTQHFFGSGSSKQEIVELFNSSRTIDQRVLVIVLAVVIAPITEEFLFRFFLYGVFKRYFGAFLGLIMNASLFAAVHTHLPSFVPLFVLGSFLTIAYEWSGSILVAMTMHSLFNSVSLVFLAFPEIFQR